MVIESERDGRGNQVGAKVSAVPDMEAPEEYFRVRYDLGMMRIFGNWFWDSDVADSDNESDFLVYESQIEVVYLWLFLNWHVKTDEEKTI